MTVWTPRWLGGPDVKKQGRGRGHPRSASPAEDRLHRCSVQIGVPLQTPAPLLTKPPSREGASNGPGTSSIGTLRMSSGRWRWRTSGQQGPELNVPRRLRQVPLTDRLFARALAHGATSELPTEPAVEDLWTLAA